MDATSPSYDGGRALTRSSIRTVGVIALLRNRRGQSSPEFLKTLGENFPDLDRDKPPQVRLMLAKLLSKEAD